MLWTCDGHQSSLIGPRGLPTLRQELAGSSLKCADLLKTIEESTIIVSLSGTTDTVERLKNGDTDSWQYPRFVSSVSDGLSLQQQSDGCIEQNETSLQALQRSEVVRQIVGIESRYRLQYRGTFPFTNGELWCKTDKRITIKYPSSICQRNMLNLNSPTISIGSPVD
jgi:hypothetical protein